MLAVQFWHLEPAFRPSGCASITGCVRVRGCGLPALAGSDLCALGGPQHAVRAGAVFRDGRLAGRERPAA
jgi:hypothetical protein